MSSSFCEKSSLVKDKLSWKFDYIQMFQFFVHSLILKRKPISIDFWEITVRLFWLPILRIPQNSSMWLKYTVHPWHDTNFRNQKVFCLYAMNKYILKYENKISIFFLQKHLYLAITLNVLKFYCRSLGYISICMQFAIKTRITISSMKPRQISQPAVQ